jgi:hypothetical protein
MPIKRPRKRASKRASRGSMYIVKKTEAAGSPCLIENSTGRSGDREWSMKQAEACRCRVATHWRRKTPKPMASRTRSSQGRETLS